MCANAIFWPVWTHTSTDALCSVHDLAAEHAKPWRSKTILPRSTDSMSSISTAVHSDSDVDEDLADEDIFQAVYGTVGNAAYSPPDDTSDASATMHALPRTSCVAGNSLDAEKSDCASHAVHPVPSCSLPRRRKAATAWSSLRTVWERVRNTLPANLSLNKNKCHDTSKSSTHNHQNKKTNTTNKNAKSRKNSDATSVRPAQDITACAARSTSTSSSFSTAQDAALVYYSSNDLRAHAAGSRSFCYTVPRDLEEQAQEYMEVSDVELRRPSTVSLPLFVSHVWVLEHCDCDNA
ncbi:hypothetical protein PTSG_01880 [Salpingoeca rosetta]|uniref:Uncharacterized protein n=1 Tax=Salpingoeca rosetta (strain ATCC 50818 / BSB-021) TaxID=946362 RepID=F2TZ80_SALR5|nr:uncharacterized protein PTSG_01880 [Salpingoeca rosetta]EGD78904.1 hypothetical protein PTSG_01880 [Salpingoeca rosetta]|eukprot:XP_004997860.1 hypothetical protein PTSG_01880 [Salpingoeca rosetta]